MGKYGHERYKNLSEYDKRLLEYRRKYEIKKRLIFWLALFRVAVVVDFFLSIQKHIKKFCASGKYFFIFYIFRMSIEKSEKYYVMLKSYALVKIQQCFLEKKSYKMF